MNAHEEHELLLSFLNDELADDETAALEARLKNQPALADRLARLAIDEGNIAEWARGRDKYDGLPRPSKLARARRIAVVVASTALLLAVAAFAWTHSGRGVAILKERAGAEFAEPQLPLPLGAAFDKNQDYALRKGMIEIEFRSGVIVIVEAPAVFRIAGPTRIEAELGGYSVDVPDGAEGFRIDSPSGQVKDLGTRFSVHIGESGETDVQVVQGRTDVIRDGAVVSKLSTGQARRIAAATDTDIQPIAFDASRYMTHLPDRVVAYQGQRRGSGVEDLLNVTVQRGGRTYTYSPSDLIGVELLHFHATENTNVLTASGKFDKSVAKLSPTERRGLLDGDWKLNTGVINPGGSKQPRTVDATSDTPGLAVRFARPVVNGPGPDVVLFEMQMSVHPPEGDFFHVSPLTFSQGLHAHTVTSYDIDRNSGDAQQAATFHLYVFQPTPTSLEALLNDACRGRNPNSSDFKILAVGIDLSWLGYPPGATAEGIFIQDAADDVSQIDPTVIVGLPEVK